MNSILEAKVKSYLISHWHYNPYDCGTIVEQMNALAIAGGNALDDPFAFVGLAAGCEARIASAIVDRALLGGGAGTSEYEIRAQVNEWLRRNRRKGR